MIRINITIALFLISILSAQALDITGVVLDDNGNPLVDVNIISDSVGTISDEDGVFRIRLLPGQSLHFSHIGYQSQSIMPESLHVVVVLKRQVLETLPITVEANRAITGVTPVAFSTLTEEEINRNYSVQDIPMVLAGEPGIYAYSESGSGTGYSYVSIRGFDQSRIAVIIDNVPLNDNESHQVYWVDHGDLLSNAKDVQIQRGIGNSLYGASAFGGSINVQTRIASEEESITMKSGFGSFGTYKFSSSYHSGLRFGPSASFTARLSQIKSDGYREFHNSLQRSAFFGLERRTRQWLHQVRINLGYENTRLVWDGVSETDLADREARRKSYQGYTDDFLQQIYSWNATWTPSSAFKFANTIYIVKGAGYYEVEKFGVDWYSYGLDVLDSYPDSVELSLTTDLLRRKWIVNQYTGWTPTMTKKLKNGRLDVGLELRLYTGDHFGEVSHFSAPALEQYFGGTWYRYYRYRGEKSTQTYFTHLVFQPKDFIYLTGDLQFQSHDWQLRQKMIGHAAGHRLDALWEFFNPRFGFVTRITPKLSLFVNVGRARKEPADNQIISADDVWSTPVQVAAESIWDYETGISFHNSYIEFNVNGYIIEYKNEQLKNINIEQEGEYSYYSADRTRHQGLELETTIRPLPSLIISGNGTLNYDIFTSGMYTGNYLPHFPRSLMNLRCVWQKPNYEIGIHLKYVGLQFLDDENRWDIAPWTVANLYGQYTYRKITVKLRIDNIFDKLYATNGYGYQWDGQDYIFYWPAATRSLFGSIEYEF